MPHSCPPQDSVEVTELEQVISVVRHSDTSEIPAGITYLGQMIAHDIVPATKVSLNNRNVSPYLMLDSLYGNPQPFDTSGEALPSPYLSSTGRFEYCRITGPDGIVSYDFKRRQDGRALVAITPEQRNDENIIISQLTVVWMRLHNYLLEKGFANSPGEARSLVIKTFQFITVEEVLGEVLNTEVFKFYFRKNSENILVEKMAVVPHFFSHASWRFGHSMVLPNYTLTATHSRSSSTQNIFNKEQKLKPEHTLDWVMFFGPAKSQKAMNLDTQFSGGMLKIGNNGTKCCHLVNIITRNLNAGFEENLPSGAEYVEKLKTAIQNDQVANLVMHELTISEFESSIFGNLPHFNLKSLPLWPYILLEAELRENGQRLGMLGSILNAEVLRSSISNAPISIYENGKYNLETTLTALGSWGKFLSSSAKDKNGYIYHITQLLNQVN